MSFRFSVLFKFACFGSSRLHLKKSYRFRTLRPDLHRRSHETNKSNTTSARASYRTIRNSYTHRHTDTHTHTHILGQLLPICCFLIHHLLQQYPRDKTIASDGIWDSPEAEWVSICTLVLWDLYWGKSLQSIEVADYYTEGSTLWTIYNHWKRPRGCVVWTLWVSL